MHRSASTPRPGAYVPQQVRESPTLPHQGSTLDSLPSNELCYHVPCSLSSLPSCPKWSIPKGKIPDYIDLARRLARQIPGPGQHYVAEKWRCARGTISKAHLRSFIDLERQRTRNMPGPTTYSPVLKVAVKYSKLP